MRKFNPCFSLIVLAASFCFSSCQKQLRWPDEPVTPGVQLLPETNCKPAVLGVQSGSSWTTIAQKWYVNSKVSYLKTIIDPSGIEPGLSMDWGELTYEFNQVYLRDVASNNKIVMRVTVDADGRPEASYYYNGSHSDTTYYYYTGKRLDSTISIYEIDATHSWQKYRFSYDIYGSVEKIDGFPNVQQLQFVYDYTKPVAGIIWNFQLATPIKLMEFMELVKLPMRHAFMQYKDCMINGNGLTHSYMASSNTYYNGWECGIVNSPMSGSGRQQGITSLNEFKALYPYKK